mmetsp:Transcript_19851/g.34162  ORF Transcript_19851/g.34162 Transcript_19851/m.34162 type:complete len:258 (-) Transcript_19851:76-849(-)
MFRDRGAGAKNHSPQSPRTRDHVGEGQGGGGDTPCGQGGHHRVGVDGLLPPLRVDARHRTVCARQVAGSGRDDLPRQGHPLHRGHRGRRLQEGEDRLLGQCVRLRHELHQGSGHAGAPRGRGRGRRHRHQQCPAQGCGRDEGEQGGPCIRGAVQAHGAAQRLHPRPHRLLRHRLHLLSQARHLLHKSTCSADALEADRVLPAGHPHHQPGRDSQRHPQGPSQRQEPSRHRHYAQLQTRWPQWQLEPHPGVQAAVKTY